MKILVTGGAGFIGRWLVKKLIESGYDVCVLDDLSNGRKENLEDFDIDLEMGDIRDRKMISDLFKNNFDVCIHAAAQINVQESLDNPEKAFSVNVEGTFNILQEARKYGTKLVMIGTCMAYNMADTAKPIDENHPLKPASPYAGSKLAAEELAMSYHLGYNLPVVILRPFNVYGPFQKSNMEGGVVSIFIKRHLEGGNLEVYGKGTQTRDLLYAEDCADFIVRASFDENAIGQIINAGSGKDISINDLAFLICKEEGMIKHVPHHHPQSEIQKLVCDNSKAKRLLGWEPKITLEKGVRITEKWISDTER
jgi:UDP-glucose 4-epimerase